jgi:hypothetical protein
LSYDAAMKNVLAVGAVGTLLAISSTSAFAGGCPLPAAVHAFVDKAAADHKSLLVTGLKYDATGGPGSQILQHCFKDAVDSDDARFDELANAPVYAVNAPEKDSPRYGKTGFFYYDTHTDVAPADVESPQMAENALVAEFQDHASNTAYTADHSQQLARVAKEMHYVLFFKDDGTLLSVIEITGVTGKGKTEHLATKKLFGKNGAAAK